ncbi:phosphoribosyltransferase domain-containing protein [Deinococcus hopiensis]|uniref:TRSP domain C terminus to PRTase_2 n=1 Tax=Deinococcus hopiensis KR-140 TaxID=695939 RepID=A0A1W1V4V8_9DEIO|nr:phosphoribosyltransferase domain-containing protein [Deinococcus hopiensis]SMB88439.1 TRSP domain C terminus to PRTase_2 [Deinococcus hopiensis KR-140]
MTVGGMQALTADLPAGRLTLRAQGWPLEELLDIGLRENPRRPFLLVSRVLGKHLPTDPRVMRTTHQELARQVIPALGGPWALVGMAETATALAEGVGEELSALTSWPGLIGMTTRYGLEGREALSLEETHSHASQLRLYRPGPELAPKLARVTDLVFVDDEVTTGRTLARLAASLRAWLPQLARVHLVTLGDFSGGQAAPLLAEGAQVSVQVHALATGELTFTPHGDWTATLPDVEARFAPAPLSNHARGWRRASVTPSPAPPFSSRPGERLLVLGTGEAMYRPYRVALALAEKGAEVRFMATTRSPALPFGCLGERLEFPDNYSEGTPNYLYAPHPERYSRLLLLHETPAPPVLPGEWPNLTAARLP